MDYRQLYDRLAVNFLGRSLASGDGLPANEIDEAERRIGVALPTALRVYYLVAGLHGKDHPLSYPFLSN